MDLAANLPKEPPSQPPPPIQGIIIGTGGHEGLQWRRAAAVLCALLVPPQNGRRDRSVSLPGEQRAPRHHLRSAVAFVALGALVVVRHLQAGPPEAALDVEALVVLAAVEDRLVAARLYGDVVERLDEAQAQLLALLVLGDGDVLDVPDRPEIVDAGVANGPLALFSRGSQDEKKTKNIGERGNEGAVSYNFRSTSSAPVATILGGLALVSSMMTTK